MVAIGKQKAWSPLSNKFSWFNWKNKTKLPDNNVSALKTAGHYGDEGKLSEENETWSEPSVKGRTWVGGEE